MPNSVQGLSIRTSSREELVDITEQVRRIVSQIGVQSGIVWIYSPHTTAGITIQENADPDVQADILSHLRTLVPKRSDFRHSEGNSDAHIKCSLVGASQAVPVSEGRLAFGTWQSIYFCEFDGPRNRRVLVKVIVDD